MTKKQSKPIPVEAVRHQAKRANIPTRELRDFVAEDEAHPKTILYPRDPSLDPQLVWKGKDQQDQADLAVPAVPIYIQEKIQPQAIIEQVRAHLPSPTGRGAGGEGGGDVQLSLFSDFNGITFEDLVDFYHHEQNWANRMILGDSLQVMTSLAEKEGLKGRVQMIYMDPPYGIKFGSNWQVSTRKRDVKDGKAEDATRQPEQVKAFRDTWQLGIHSYLSYLRDRLVVARELLTESGSVFVQIGDTNLHLVRSILDEVFGAENFIAVITFKKTTGQTSKFLTSSCDYVLWYAKDLEQLKYREIFKPRALGEEGAEAYTNIILPDGSIRAISEDEQHGQSQLPKGSRVFRYQILQSQRENRPSGPGSAMYFEIAFEGRRFVPSGTRGWTTTQEGIEKLRVANRLGIQGNSLSYIRFLEDFPAVPLNNLWDDTQSGSAMDKIYVVQTNIKVIQRCLLMTTDPGDLVLDPTCGSGTTAYVAEQWGRRWITCDTSRVAVALARTRLMAARFPYYLLADSPEGVLKESEAAGRLPPTPLPKTGKDIRQGFVYKRVPHITLKSIANNPDLDAIHAHYQPQLDDLRAQINAAAGQNWQEWEIPADLTGLWRSQGLPDLSGLYAQTRRQRQREMDDAIARRADTELLYDQPYEDAKRVRVSGPFTVESLSPHRVLAADADLPASEWAGRTDASAGQFETMIIENLRKAGVQNTFKHERLALDHLAPYAGVWLHAAGEYTETPTGEGATEGMRVKRVAVHIGPEHGTVGPGDIKEAAKEAVQGVGFDLLLVCGFAFDPHVAEEARRYGKLTVLPVRMNPDLAMGDELLKKTGAGNLFMIFGEPDMDVREQADGRLVVTLKGMDIYDPTTGQIRSSSTDDIACWFIDTDYNGESFFVRQAYFTGADEPYDKLKRALRAEIDEAAWAALYSTRSYPFERPKTGKVAVKVINHYGDEVLKVYGVESLKH